MKFLSEWTEIVQPYPTHFDHKGNICARIDRGWVSCPSNLLIKLQLQSHVLGSPEEMFGSEISGHSSFVISIGVHPSASADTRPKAVMHYLPKFICKDPI